MNKSEYLKQRAIDLGLCHQWAQGWGNPSEKELIEKYKKGIDFCIEHSYPSNDEIIELFGDFAEKEGVFTDSKIKTTATHPIIVINGKSKGVIECIEYNVHTIYVRHNSNVKIMVKDNAIVFIRAFDKAKINIVNDGKNKVIVRKADKVKVTHKGDVRL